MGVVINGAVNKKFRQCSTLKEQLQNMLKKKAAPKKFKNILIVRIHDNIKHIADFFARSTNRARFQMFANKTNC